MCKCEHWTKSLGQFFTDYTASPPCSILVTICIGAHGIGKRLGVRELKTKYHCGE